VPEFARSIGIDLDELGITVCSVGGVNFGPYVKLATALDLFFCVITDWDPQPGRARALGWDRALSLLRDIRVASGQARLARAELRPLEANEEAIRTAATVDGIFMNTDTLELEIARTEGLQDALLAVIEAEQFGRTRQRRIAGWKADPSTIDSEQLLSIIADIGKGRLAGRLAVQAVGLQPPIYIQNALEYVVEHVRP
jgi:putative ATP-dependent endonuclease of OLD family